jgi:regulator of protease activity HflC (stomatin/prohibitin superfamily)
MLVIKYLLVILGIALFGSSGALVVYDVFLAAQLRRLLRFGLREPSATVIPSEGGLFGHPGEPSQPGKADPESSAPPVFPFDTVRWRLALRLALLAPVPLLLAAAIAVVPDGFAGVRVSQIWGARPGTLYPGVHLITPLIDSIALFDTREQVYTTLAAPSPKTPDKEVLTVQAREGLNIGLAVSVRYRLDPQRLSYIHANLPHEIGDEVVAPTVATIYRQLAPNYITREIFASKREELRSSAATAITQRLASDGILVREVLLRDLRLPEEYAQGLEGLLLKEQENERLGTETEIKEKQVKIAELEAEAQKGREIKQAEAQAQVRVLQAKAEADAMQYTLPLKQKQIEQSKLEAQARKEATIENAEAAAQAKIVDAKAEVERQKNLSEAEANRIRITSEAEANRIRVTAAADAERLRSEAAVLKQNPMLIQKIIAERLSDKLQIIMVPMDGKNFFASDVLRSAFSGANSGNSAYEEDGSDSAQPAVTAAQKRNGRRQ